MFLRTWNLHECRPMATKSRERLNFSTSKTDGDRQVPYSPRWWRNFFLVHPLKDGSLCVCQLCAGILSQCFSWVRLKTSFPVLARKPQAWREPRMANNISLQCLLIVWVPLPLWSSEIFIILFLWIWISPWSHFLLYRKIYFRISLWSGKSAINSTTFCYLWMF